MSQTAQNPPGVPAGHVPADGVPADGVPAGPGSFGPPPPVPFSAPPPPPAPPRTGPPPSVSPPAPGSDVDTPSSRLDKFRAASQQSVEPMPSSYAQRSVELEERKRLESRNRLWEAVRRVMSVIQQNEEVKRLTAPFVLTRDPVLDSSQRRRLGDGVIPLLAREGLNFGSPDQANTVLDLVYDELLGISVLGPFWRDERITEVLVDSWDSVCVEQDGRLSQTPVKFRDSEHADSIARDMASRISGRGLSPTNPLVTAELPDARVTFAMRPVAKSGLSISIRKFRDLMGMDGLLRHGAVTPEMAEFLADCVRARANVLVSGGTGTGKTTMINALSEFIPDNERVITIEDAFELKLTNRFWVPMQTKESASADDTNFVSLADLLKVSLRMRPDRIIVGEIREADAAAVMLQAANTGHDGSMTTIHANSADRALNFRLAGMVRTGANMPQEVAAAEVASAIDVVVQVVRRFGRRFVSEVSVVDITGLEDGLIKPHKIFDSTVTPQPDGDPVVCQRRVGSVGAETELAMKMSDLGIGQRWMEHH